MKFAKLLIILLFVGPLFLSAVTYPIINYQTSDGLPQNQVNALIQGKLGYIYIGTQSGIGKFDGTNFSIITKENGLPNNFITDFDIDHRYNLWVATQGGLSRLNPKNTKPDNYLPSTVILAVTADPKADLVWVITDKEIYYFKGNILHKYEEINAYTNKTGPVKEVTVTSKGITYFYSDRGIVEVNNHKIHIIHTPGNIGEINVLKPIYDKMAVGTSNGLFLLEGRQLKEFIKLPPRQRNITDMAVDCNQNLWLGTTRGVIFYDKKENTTLTITKENGLGHDYVTRLLIDKENSVFIGTQWGISQLSTRFFKMYDVADGLPHEFVWCFEENNGSIFIGTDQGVADLRNGQIHPVHIEKQLNGSSVRAIIKMKENDFLIGTRDNGIYEWNGQNRLKKIHEDAHVLCGVKSAFDDRAWFGTDNGLLKYDEYNFKSFSTGLRDHNVWCLSFLDRNTLLVGTGKGIQIFRKEQFLPSPLEEIIGQEIINDIQVLSNSQIAVATELKGLFIYDRKENNVTHLDTSSGLLHNDVWSAVEDNDGSLWYNTSVSLDKYADGSISHFTKKTGLFGHEGGLHAAFKDSRGKIYFGIAPGVVEIMPQDKKIEIPEPTLYIKKFIVNGKALEPGNHFVLPYDRNNIEFHYMAVTTRKEKPLKYKTMLSPLDRCWSASTSNTLIKYLNLPPNQYIFKVKANNGGGGNSPWFDAEKDIIFVIKKPFWLTWWFVGISALVFLLLVFIIIKSRLKALESQKKQLEEVVKQRTEEIVRKNEELAHLSLTDPLTDLKNRRYLEEKIKEEINILERHIFDDSRAPREDPELQHPKLAVFVMDIDRFKKVNDMYGHKAGDIIIIEIARLLQDTLRNSDTIVRWGGEEFLIITWQKTMENSHKLAERLREKIALQPFKVDDDIIVNKTVSIGFAHFPFILRDITTVSWGQVVSTADSALYIAKNNGRNLTVGIKTGEKTLDIDYKEILSDIEMGVEKKYIELVCSKKKLKLPGQKT